MPLPQASRAFPGAMPQDLLDLIMKVSFFYRPLHFQTGSFSACCDIAAHRPAANRVALPPFALPNQCEPLFDDLM
jgi:hypothetical protein